VSCFLARPRKQLMSPKNGSKKGIYAKGLVMTSERYILKLESLHSVESPLFRDSTLFRIVITITYGLWP